MCFRSSLSNGVDRMQCALSLCTHSNFHVAAKYCAALPLSLNIRMGEGDILASFLCIIPICPWKEPFSKGAKFDVSVACNADLQSMYHNAFKKKHVKEKRKDLQISRK